MIFHDRKAFKKKRDKKASKDDFLRKLIGSYGEDLVEVHPTRAVWKRFYYLSNLNYKGAEFWHIVDWDGWKRDLLYATPIEAPGKLRGYRVDPSKESYGIPMKGFRPLYPCRAMGLLVRVPSLGNVGWSVCPFNSPPELSTLFDDELSANYAFNIKACSSSIEDIRADGPYIPTEDFLVD